MPDALVVDCSVAAKWALVEPGDVEASHLLDQQEAGAISLIAPDLLLVEFASLIAKRVRRKQLSIDQAHEMFWIMEHSDLEFFDTRRLLGAALELALANQMSAWDCVYLALALEQNCCMITADRRLFRGRASRHPAIRLLR
jgi:predicted nucleic acid-binding protein